MFAADSRAGGLSSMWDEHQRFAKVVSKIFIWLLTVSGVVLAVFSLAAGSLDPFIGFLVLLGGLAVMTLIYGLVAVSVGGVLLGVTSGFTYFFRWLRNLFRRSLKDLDQQGSPPVTSDS
jgi:hypothetical protein